MLPVHTCICEDSYSHTQYILCAFQWHPKASLQTAFTHIAARPPAPWPRTPFSLQEIPKCLGIPSTSVLQTQAVALHKVP